jgi:hypothetical protein
MIFKNITMFMLIAVMAIQFGCKGKKGEVGPAGPTDSNVGLSSDGSYIKGTVTTTTITGKAVSFSFNDAYSDSYNYYGGDANYTDQTLYKNLESGWFLGSNQAYLKVYLDSISDLVPTSPYIEINATHTITADSTFAFYINGTPTITNYTYSAATRTISGNYTITNSNTNNGNSATVAGSFKLMNLKTTVYRQGQ